MAARTYLDLPLDLIEDGTNVRSRIDADLRRSIEAVGVLQPITVAPLEDDRYLCLYGHRRLAAARAAKLTTIPAIVEKVPDQLPIRQLIENQHRRAVHPIDVATTLRDILAANPGMTRKELGRQLGRSDAWVTMRLQILDMDADRRRRLEAGEITADKAYAEHKAAADRTGRNAPRRLRAGGRREGARVIVELERYGNEAGQATVELERDAGTVSVLLEDSRGYGVEVHIGPESARILGLRLTQAYQAAAPAKVA